MSDDATTDWLTALRGALIADAQLMSEIGSDHGANAKVYTRPPAQMLMPYVTTGDVSSIDWSTANTDGQEFRQDVECWDQQQSSGNESPSEARVRRMMARIRAIVHREDLAFVPFAVPGRNLVYAGVIGSRIQLEPDGVTNRGIVTIRVLLGN